MVVSLLLFFFFDQQKFSSFFLKKSFCTYNRIPFHAIESISTFKTMQQGHLGQNVAMLLSLSGLFFARNNFHWTVTINQLIQNINLSDIAVSFCWVARLVKHDFSFKCNSEQAPLLTKRDNQIKQIDQSYQRIFFLSVRIKG